MTYDFVTVQGKLVSKDFNIEDEAGGVNKPIVKSFSAMISDGTLEIRFYWAGKGTDAIPSPGVYGPLISAISVEAGKFSFCLKALPFPGKLVNF